MSSNMRVARMTEEKTKLHIKLLNTIGFKTDNLPKIFTIVDILNFECVNGHTIRTSLRTLKRAGCCSRCKKLKFYFDTKEILESEGYIVLTKEEEYENVHSKIEYICSESHKNSSSCTSLRQGRRCKTCGIEKSSNSKKRSIEEIYDLFNKENYTILEFLNNYIGETTRVSVQCDNNHFYETSISNFVLGYRCRECFVKNISGENSHLWTGLTPIKTYIRHTINEWKRDSLENANYKCFISGKSGKFHVHHPINFTTIIKEVLSELELPILDTVSDYGDRLNDIVELNLKKHYEYGLGVVMLEDVHKKFHSAYGVKNNTMEQVLEFKKDYENGKYNIV